MKKIILIILFFLIFTLILFIKTDEIRINLKIENLSTDFTDSFLAENLKDELSNIENIKEVYTFSKPKSLNIYCKINFLNKNKTINDIQIKLNDFLSTLENDIKNNIEIDFDYNYHKKYDYFLVIYSDNINYINLKNISDTIYDELLDNKIFSKIELFGQYQRVVYILYDTNTLLKYDLSLSDIVDTLQKNNTIQNETYKNTSDKNYSIDINSYFNNIESIKNSAIHYKNNNFSVKLQDIFEFENTIKTPPDYYIDFDNSKAIFIALSKKFFYPNFLIERKIANFIDKNNLNINLKLIKTSNYFKNEIYLDNNSNINSTYILKEKLENIFQKEKIKNILFLTGIDLPKTSKKEEFLELDKNKLVIFANKKYTKEVQNILNKNKINYIKSNKFETFEDYSKDKLYSNLKNKNQYSNFTTYKTIKSIYNIDNNAINDYFINKKDIINTIFSNNEGLFCTNLYTNSTKIPIYLKNKSPYSEEIIYSTKYKNILYLNSFTTNEIAEDFYSIVRKNGKFFMKIKY